MAKKVIILFSTLLFIFLLAFLSTPRRKIVKLLSVDNQNKAKKIDIYFVFSGGFVKNKMGKSTSERIDFLKKLLKKHENTPFVFLDYKRGKEIVDNMLIKEIKNKSIVSDYKYNESLGGTENNVLELVSILKQHPEFKRIGIITSLYHEKRVKLILNYYLKKEKIKNIKIYFLHDNSRQEVYSCSFKRYLKLIVHEIGGILYFKLHVLFN